MRLRTPAALAATGLLALIGTLASSLPASASTSEAPIAAAASREQDACPQWDFAELEAQAAAAVAVTHPEWTALTAVEASGAATTDLTCIDRWWFRFGNPSSSTAQDREIQLNPHTGGVVFVRDYGRATPLPADRIDPDQMLAYFRERGYADTVTSLSMFVHPTGLHYTVMAGSGTSTYFDLVNGKPGPVKVNGLLDIDLPDRVVAERSFVYERTTTVRAYACPAHHPYLSKQDHGWGAPGTIMSDGYRPLNPAGGAGNLTLPIFTTVDGLASGWPETPNGITRIDEGRLYVLCTDDPAEGFAPAADAPSAE